MKKISFKAVVVLSLTLTASISGANVPNKYLSESAERDRLNYEGAMMDMDRAGDCITDACLAWKYPNEDFYGRPEGDFISKTEIPICMKGNVGYDLIPPCSIGCVYESELDKASDAGMSDQEAIEEFVLPPSMCAQALPTTLLKDRQ